MPFFDEERSLADLVSIQYDAASISTCLPFVRKYISEVAFQLCKTEHVPFVYHSCYAIPLRALPSDLFDYIQSEVIVLVFGEVIEYLPTSGIYSNNCTFHNAWHII
jgi:hypothetical protein